MVQKVGRLEGGGSLSMQHLLCLGKERGREGAGRKGGRERTASFAHCSRHLGVLFRACLRDYFFPQWSNLQHLSFDTSQVFMPVIFVY